ncbi:uncharacterized protein [Physcomitrium patens]|uniref:PUA domain-containing protein n=1 Tax=Physcomitrium patens TaxID=3218 RepID=A0A2K1IND2_PHYPA|nr:uncharacterized protein LOC112274970 isoform X1 [Physcomitrium patens]XP_024360633.1 uncharacterized protein LOC112274970 isoform X1 [Physcomitrium patens]PNR30777.1 hypothetical protein PHYPA_027093 [Physcomitrium patens]|eukprot:XP_024360632.1 uncharacterized protein LOC112274970 isoform X1 [Physcomitrella patens]
MLSLKNGVLHFVHPSLSIPCFRHGQALRMGTAGNSTRMRPRIHSFPVMAGGAQVKVMESIIGDIAKDRSKVPKVVLKRGKTQLFRGGNPMVYSGAIDRVVGRPPPVAGDLVMVTDGAEQPIAWGVYNPLSMFAVRIMQTEDEARREPECVLNMETLLLSRFSAARKLRKTLGLPSDHTNVFRLVNSEGDRLSGLIVDVLGEQVVVASSAAWVERHRSTIELAVGKAIKTSHVSWRPSVEILKEEGLQVSTSEDSSLDSASDVIGDFEVVENGVRYLASLDGQKTGFYADQRDSRLLLRSLASGSSVLDLCCYSGGFALNAALGGASYITGVDSSSPALELAKSNASLNRLDANSIDFVKADVAEYMKSALSEGKQWDIVVLDPPKLAPNRKVLQRATAKYRNLNAMAIRLTKPGGLLMTCSCSGAMTQSGNFLSVIQEAAMSANRRVTQLRYAGAAPDHTIDPAYPEGTYLTNVLLRVQ